MRTNVFDNLKETINQDCKTYIDLVDGGFYQYMYLNESTHSKESGLYQLILNGEELWYGTLEEINAIIKSMITRVKHNDFLDVKID